MLGLSQRVVSRTCCSALAASLAPARAAPRGPAAAPTAPRRRSLAAAAAAAAAAAGMDTAAAAAAAGAAVAAPSLLCVHASRPELLAAAQAAFEGAPSAGPDAPALAFGAPLAAAGSAFDAAAYFAALRSTSVGHVLLAAGTMASTQEYARAAAGRLPDGAVLLADRQSSGRGRGGNVWTSPEGCLMFTVAKRVRIAGAAAPFINYVVCLAVVQARRGAARAGFVPGAQRTRARVAGEAARSATVRAGCPGRRLAR